jgi:hypothetical protein
MLQTLAIRGQYVATLVAKFAYFQPTEPTYIQILPKGPYLRCVL